MNRLYLAFNIHVERWTNRAYSSFRPHARQLRGLTATNKRLLYLTVLIPVLSYGFQIWYRLKGRWCKRSVHKLAKVQHAAARWITGGFATSLAGALELLAGLAPMTLNLDRLYQRSVIRHHGLHEYVGLKHYSHTPVHWNTV